MCSMLLFDFFDFCCWLLTFDRLRRVDAAMVIILMLFGIFMLPLIQPAKYMSGDNHGEAPRWGCPMCTSPWSFISRQPGWLPSLGLNMPVWIVATGLRRSRSQRRTARTSAINRTLFWGSILSFLVLGIHFIDVRSTTADPFKGLADIWVYSKAIGVGDSR